jgi:hypothetical protein
LSMRKAVNYNLMWAEWACSVWSYGRVAWSLHRNWKDQRSQFKMVTWISTIRQTA